MEDENHRHDRRKHKLAGRTTNRSTKFQDVNQWEHRIPKCEPIRLQKLLYPLFISLSSPSFLFFLFRRLRIPAHQAHINPKKKEESAAAAAMVAAAIMAATTPVSFFGSSSHTAMRLSGSCCSCSCSYSLASSRSQLGSGAFLAQTFHSLGFSSNVEWLFMRPPRRRRRRRKGSNHQYQHHRSILSPALLLPLLPAAAAVFQQTLVTPANFILPHFVHEGTPTKEGSLSLSGTLKKVGLLCGGNLLTSCLCSCNQVLTKCHAPLNVWEECEV